jgi:hypothetical protein
MDLDVLIINGCSVLFWNHLNEKVDDPDRKNYGLEWAKLLTQKDGPLLAILGYRYRAPLDEPWGNLIADEMAKAIVDDLGTDWDRYTRKWLEINSRHQICWTAAAFDKQGYWYINNNSTSGGHNQPIVPVGFDHKQKPGTIMGPFPIP